MQWLRVICSTGLLLASVAGATGAQAPSESHSGEETRPAEVEGSETEAADSSRGGSAQIPGDVTYLPGPDGQLVPVPTDADLKEYLEFVRKKNRPQADEPRQPRYSVTALALQGESDGERATLVATIQVQIHVKTEWVKVPLRMNEAVLRDADYHGPGEAIFDQHNRQEGPEEAGHSWWFQGDGLHELSLSLIVPVQKQTPTRRLQITLPRAAASSLKLTVPLQPVSVNAPEQSATRTQPVGADATEITVYGLGTLLDLQWEAAPKQAQVETVLESATSLTLDMPGESVLLTGTQRILARQGRFDTLRIHLPDAFALRDLKVDPTPISEIAPPDARQVTVSFAEPLTGPVELRWTLASDKLTENHTLTLEGFEVERARRQTGEIALRRVEDRRMTARMQESQFVHRINASELAGNGEIAGAYRFSQQPFRLVLDLETIEPYYAAESRCFLNLSENWAELETVLRFEVYRGTVDAVELNWPNWQSEGWEIASLASPGLVEVHPGSDADRDTLRISLIEPQSGRFELPFKARRRVPRRDGEPFPLSLPAAQASSLLPNTLVVAEADNLETDVKLRNGTSLQSLSTRERKAIEVPEGMSRRRRSAYRLPQQAHQLVARITTHEQHIRTESTALVEWVRDRLSIRQRITYDVSYEPLSEARLLVPAELQRRVKFATGDGLPLFPEWTGTDTGTSQRVRLEFSDPQLGRFDVIATYSVELPEELSADREQTFDLPIIRSSKADEASARVEWSPSGRFDLAVNDPSWRRQLDGENRIVWSTDAPSGAIALRLTASGTPPQEYAVRRALIQTTADEGGLIRSTAQYRVEGTVSTLALRFEPEIVPESFWWDGTKLSADQIIEKDGDGRDVRLILPADTESPPFDSDPQTGDEGSEDSPRNRADGHLLTIQFHSERPAPFGWSQQHQLRAPRFPPDVWVEQTVWKIVLPFNQHLFTEPTGFTPHYRWKRTGVFWSRIPQPPWADWDAGAAIADWTEWSEPSEGNSYIFSRFGPAASMQFHSMSRSLIVLLGAGLALFVGFMLLKIPATRSMLTFLMLGFGLALAGLWYTAPVQVLLQPGLLGLLLAVVAAVLERGLKKEPPQSVLPLSSPSQFVGRAQPEAGASSWGPVPVRGDVRTEDQSGVHPPSSTGEELPSSYESRSQT